LPGAFYPLLKAVYRPQYKETEQCRPHSHNVSIHGDRDADASGNHERCRCRETPRSRGVAITNDRSRSEEGNCRGNRFDDTHRIPTHDGRRNFLGRFGQQNLPKPYEKQNSQADEHVGSQACPLSRCLALPTKHSPQHYRHHCLSKDVKIFHGRH
jgi:hypothetical protein